MHFAWLKKNALRVEERLAEWEAVKVHVGDAVADIVCDWDTTALQFIDGVADEEGEGEIEADTELVAT